MGFFYLGLNFLLIIFEGSLTELLISSIAVVGAIWGLIRAIVVTYNLIRHHHVGIHPGQAKLLTPSNRVVLLTLTAIEYALVAFMMFLPPLFIDWKIGEWVLVSLHLPAYLLLVTILISTFVRRRWLPLKAA